MNLETKPDPSLSADAEQAIQSADWSEHEHVSEHVQLEAQKLVQLVGSAELAKNAIDVVEQRQGDSPSGDSTRPRAPSRGPNDRLLKALEQFETSLATPVVSGELTDWVIIVTGACECVGLLLHGDIQREHAEIYATIALEDPELSSQVDTLRATDEQFLLVDFVNVQTRLKQLLDRAESVEQDELKVSPFRSDVAKQALAFVIGARTQETAIATWLSEAINRDRGFGD